MRVGDLVRYSQDLGSYDHLSRKVYIVEEIIDHGVNGKWQTCFLLGWTEPDTDGRRRKFFQSQLEVISEHR